MPERYPSDSAQGAWATALHHPLLAIAVLALATVGIHGYHFGVDDAEIYVPAIEKAADHALFPFGSEFFLTHARLSFFSDLVGGGARLTGLPVDLTIFLWHIAGVFLLLVACQRLLVACFANEAARWAGVLLVACVFSVPVAGTALAIMDPYVTARTVSAPATVFVIASYLNRRPWRALAWLVATALVHFQMCLYSAALIGLLMIFDRLPFRGRTPVPHPALSFAALTFLFELGPAHGAAREALLSRTYFFVTNWRWYEWIGVFAPLAILAWFAFHPPRGSTANFGRLCWMLVLLGLLSTAIALMLSAPRALENFTRLQPMRSFHLIYILFFALLGGVVGEYFLRKNPFRWTVTFLPLIAGMILVGEFAYPASPHVEWPGGHDTNTRHVTNTWMDAFYWIRSNTPKNAVFALDPGYMLRPGEDQHGFRALAERSVLADEVKDSGAVSLFPQLADAWKTQVEAQSGWRRFGRADFERLARSYPVTWIVTRRSATAGLDCPYSNSDLSVCRVNGGFRAGRSGRCPSVRRCTE